MFKKSKKLLAVCLTLAMVLASNMTVFATDTEFSQNSESVSMAVQTDTATSNVAQYKIALTTTLTLSQDATDLSKYAGTYEAKAWGILPANQSLNFAPSTTSLTLKESGTSSTDTVTATVSQTDIGWKTTPGSNQKTLATTATSAASYKIEGTITTNITKAGSYSGTLGFTISVS